MDNNTIIIGTRGSKLALVQANLVKGFFEQAISRGQGASFQKVELQIIKTKGDRILDTPLARIGDKGLFTKEIEEALLERRIDVAVHSLKDLPTELPPDLDIRCVLERERQEDVLISRSGKGLADLPSGAVVGTSSLRRRAQLLYFRRDLTIKDIRGNVDTRLKKLDDGEYDAIILAGAGIRRCGLSERITEIISPEIMLPAVSQGIIAVQCRKQSGSGSRDNEVIRLLELLNHKESWVLALAERAFLRTLEGGCQVPVGCFTRLVGDSLLFKGVVLDLEGQRRIVQEIALPASGPESIGRRCAEAILAAGGRELLDSIRNHEGNL